MIYRIEKDGIGPYTHPTDSLVDCFDHADSLHPVGYYDCGMTNAFLLDNLEYVKKLYCGFTSFDDLCQWFSLKDRELCKDHGYTIIEYADNPHYYGSYQVLFMPSNKTGVEYDCITLERIVP